jgi:hypothetical protein
MAAVRYGLTFARRKLLELSQWLSWRSNVALSHLREFNGRFWRMPTVLSARKILSGFCAEAAVLIAIFPYLDFVLENQHIKGTSQLVGGSSPIDMEPVKRVSAILCIGCLVSAVVLAIKAPSEANNQDDEE